MFSKKSIFTAIPVALFMTATMANAATISVDKKVALQAQMQQHIDTVTIDGAISHLKFEDASIVELVPTKAHPMVLTLGDMYVLCTDFRDPTGEFVNVDFYLKEQNGQHVVFQMEIDNRAPLKKLMDDGKVVMLD